MSLYQTYRPRSFADVAGQDSIVETLQQAVKQNALSHAYLFAGSRGTGKTSIARILAKECLLSGIEDEVLRRNITQAVDDGSLVDLTEIDAASNTGVDNIRELLEKIQFTPVVAAAKVYIIDEAHMLSKGAFNALLKTLEEPPAYAFFILATTELHKIPATIQSRCQRFLFRHIREEDIVKRLQFVADTEHITVERTALRAIAHHAQGSMRDALSLLDQLRSIGKDIELQDVKERIGESGHEYVEQVLTALASGDRTGIISIVHALEEAAVPLDIFTRLLLGHARESLHEAVSANKDPSEQIAMIDRLMETLRSLRTAPLPALTLESALLSMIGTSIGVQEKKEKTESVAVPIEKPEEKQNPDAPILKENNVSHAEIKNAEVTAPELTLSALREHWPQIVQETEPPFVRMSLKNGHLHALEGIDVIIRFGSSFHRDKASSPEGLQQTEQILRRIFKQPLKLKYILDSELHSTALPEEESVNIAEAAAELF